MQTIRMISIALIACNGGGHGGDMFYVIPLPL
jgi:hypothetical protein